MLAACSIAMGLGGCAVNRRVLTADELICRKAASDARAAVERTAMIEKIVRRWKLEWDEYQAGRTKEPPTFDVLVISGGGDKGAFGAGFLLGWSTVEGDRSRPQFDVVTGVSTGALIAPFAFVGDSMSTSRVCDLYKDPKDDWVELNGVLFFLPAKESFLDPAGLRRDLANEVNERLVQDIVTGSLQERVLAIGTTNLDLGVTKTWDLTEEAERALTPGGSFKRITDILMASAAIPAAYPPVVIDDELHVDGGTTSNILIISDFQADDTPRKLFRQRYPEIPLPKTRYWVIINNRIDPPPRIVQPRWWNITEASVDTMIRSSTLTTLRYFASEVEYIRDVEGVDAELYYVAIPETWSPDARGTFDRDKMLELVDLGVRLGTDPASWKNDLSRARVRGGGN